VNAYQQVQSSEFSGRHPRNHPSTKPARRATRPQTREGATLFESREAQMAESAARHEGALLSSQHYALPADSSVRDFSDEHRSPPLLLEALAPLKATSGPLRSSACGHRPTTTDRDAVRGRDVAGHSRAMCDRLSPGLTTRGGLRIPGRRRVISHSLTS